MNTEKLKELILVLTEESAGDESFDVKKLYALLFYLDFAAHRRFGKSVTEQEYHGTA